MKGRVLPSANSARVLATWRGGSASSWATAVAINVSGEESISSNDVEAGIGDEQGEWRATNIQRLDFAPPPTLALPPACAQSARSTIAGVQSPPSAAARSRNAFAYRP